MKRNAINEGLNIERFELERLVYSCCILDYIVANKLKFKDEYIAKKNAYNIKSIIIKSMFMDCIECLYLMIPAIYKFYFKENGINKLKYKSYNNQELIDLDKASWVVVLRNIEDINLINKNTRVNITHILRIRGVLIHSNSLNINDYYNNIHTIIIKLSMINLELLLNNLVEIYNNYNKNKVELEIESIKIDINKTFKELLWEVN